jgi:hypothetical protein
MVFISGETKVIKQWHKEGSRVKQHPTTFIADTIFLPIPDLLSS